MSDLITAARKQIEYAQKELKSGDKAAALEHLTKADGFLERASADAPEAVAKVASEADPLLEPVDPGRGGKLISKAAQLDAASIAAVNNGDDPEPVGAPYAGQAAKEGYSAVVAAGTGSSITFTVFLNGAVVAVVKGDSTTDTSALADQYGLPA